MIIFQCTIEGRVPVKKNTAKKGRWGVYYSKSWLDWEAVAVREVKEAMKKFKKEKYPIEHYCRAEFVFHLKNHQWEADVSNLMEGPQDVLESCGVLKNDKLLQIVRGEKHFCGNNRLDIIIKTL